MSEILPKNQYANHMEDTIQEINQGVAGILESIPDAFFALNRQWQFIYINRHAEPYFSGKKREDLLGKTIWEEAPGATKTLAYKKYHEALATGQAVHFEENYGPDTCIEQHVYPSPNGLSVYFQDITERKKTEEALQLNRERLDLVLGSIDLGLWYCDLPFDKLIWNDKVKEHFGLPPDAIVDINLFYALLHPDDRERTRQAIEDCIENHKGYDIEYRTVAPNDSRLRWIRAIGRCFYDASGKPIRFDGITIDVTEQKETERQKDEFMAVVSHELKTPVTSLKAYTQVLQNRFMKARDERSAQHLAKMDAQLNRLTNLIGDLLDATRIEGGRLQFHEELFAFDDLVNEVVDAMQLTTHKHALRIEGKTKKLVLADRDRIGQVINNLISNAIKFSPHEKSIIAIASADKDTVKLCVRDFGVGIPKNNRDQVFQRYFRVSGTALDTFPGLGLGLYISAEIIKRQGGRIWVESEEGEGSTFCFTLPLRGAKYKQQQINTLAEEEMKHE